MASHQIFTLNSSYDGPMVVADYLRKMKTNSGLNRMLSTHNKRFFILDLNHLTFYYLPDRSAHFANSTNIPVASITRIKVTKQARGLEEDKVWKYEFVVETKSKMFELITDSKATMDKFLFAFSNIINFKTKLPLFNWDHYIGESQSPSSSPSNLPLKSQAAEDFNREPTESLNTSPQSSPQSSPSKQSDRGEEQYQDQDADKIFTSQPQQIGEISPEVSKIKEAIKIKAIINDNRDSDGQSDDQKENKQQGSNGIKKRTVSVTLRRKASGLASARGKGFEVGGENQEPEISPSSGMDASPFSEMTPVIDSPTGFRGFDVREVLPEPEKVEKLQINLKMNLQKVEDEPVEKKKAESYQEVSRRPSPGDLSVRRRPNYDMNVSRNTKSISMKNMIPRVEEKAFVGLNEVDLSHHMKKGLRRGNQNFEEVQRASMTSATARLRLGTGMSMSYARQQVVDQNVDSSPFGQEAKMFKGPKEIDSPSKKENHVAEKKSHPVNDDDWDNEMFGYDKGQLSPLKPDNSERNQKQISGSKYSFNEKKPHQQLSQRRIEFVSSRQATHNDWDDDL